MSTQFKYPFEPMGCQACRNAEGLDFDFTMAFQPILNIDTGQPYAYEALVRGLHGESAASILSKVNDSNRYHFDQACRVRAIERATSLGISDIPDCRLSINFLPNAVYRPETCIRSTLEACSQFGFPSELLMFEVTEGEQVIEPEHLFDIFTDYQHRGFGTAIDDFGAGYAGLNLLARFQPDTIKLDMGLTRGIDRDKVRHAIVEGMALICQRLNIRIVAEGVESRSESDALRALGIRYQQGYLFARPDTERLPLAHGR